MKKRSCSLALTLLLVLSLCACGEKEPPAASVGRDDSGAEPAAPTAALEPSAVPEPTSAPEPSDAPEPEKGYQPGAWITDNVSVSFYMNYAEGGENTLNTLRVYGDKAMLIAQEEGSEEPPARTVYQQTDTGVNTYSLLEFGEDKSAILIESEGKTLADFLPGVFIIAGTIEARLMYEKNWKNTVADGADTVAGRPCTIYRYGSAPAQQSFWVDDETGIILREEIATTLSGGTTVAVKTLVAEIKYDALTEADVTVDLSEYEIV